MFLKQERPEIDDFEERQKIIVKEKYSYLEKFPYFKKIPGKMFKYMYNG